MIPAFQPAALPTRPWLPPAARTASSSRITADDDPDQPEYRRQLHFVGGQWQTQNEIERGSVTYGDGHRVDVTTSWVINQEFTHGQTVDGPSDCGNGPQPTDPVKFDLKRV